MSAKTNLIYIIREDHSKVESGQAKEPTNSVICLDPSTQQEKVLACGADFYSTPKVSLDGEKICWVQWFHPSMPWYNTELRTAKLTKSGDAIIEGSAKKNKDYEGPDGELPPLLVKAHGGPTSSATTSL
ncbi:hypothetical protein EB796_002865 [Bugula neritina]|uniref:APEH n=1 Tax=Bugula neritina TaxID=10212 RepID=A0A7J7KKL6_BUGNE|nr:hypothetical protein EB796_002865 [Bugula neritina]